MSYAYDRLRDVVIPQHPALKAWFIAGPREKDGRLARYSHLREVIEDALEHRYDDGHKFLAKKYGLTTAEAQALAARPDVVEYVERWREEGALHPASALVRGRIQEALKTPTSEPGSYTDGIKVLYRQPETLSLWGIPYHMRKDVNQSPRDLFYSGHSSARKDWRWLGSPGWYGELTPAQQNDVRAFLAKWEKLDAVPKGPHEWVDLEEFEREETTQRHGKVQAHVAKTAPEPSAEDVEQARRASRAVPGVIRPKKPRKSKAPAPTPGDPWEPKPQNIEAAIDAEAWAAFLRAGAQVARRFCTGKIGRQKQGEYEFEVAIKDFPPFIMRKVMLLGDSDVGGRPYVSNGHFAIPCSNMPKNADLMNMSSVLKQGLDTDYGIPVVLAKVPTVAAWHEKVEKHQDASLGAPAVLSNGAGVNPLYLAAAISAVGQPFTIRQESRGKRGQTMTDLLSPLFVHGPNGMATVMPMRLD